MIRLTTPTHVFRFTTNPTGMSKILVTYFQNGAIILEKDKDDMTFQSRVIDGVTYYYGSYTLTQLETKKFADYYPVEIQVRALMTDGSAAASSINTIDVNRVLNDEVLS